MFLACIPSTRIRYFCWALGFGALLASSLANTFGVHRSWDFLTLRRCPPVSLLMTLAFDLPADFLNNLPATLAFYCVIPGPPPTRIIAARRYHRRGHHYGPGARLEIQRRRVPRRARRHAANFALRCFPPARQGRRGSRSAFHPARYALNAPRRSSHGPRREAAV